MIIKDERDQRVAIWVQSWATPEQIAGAEAKLAHRAWPGKVAQMLGRSKIPDEVWDPVAAAEAAAIKAQWDLCVAYQKAEAIAQLKKITALMKADIAADKEKKL